MKPLLRCAREGAMMLVLLAAAAFVGACTRSDGKTAEGSREALAARVAAYWDAKIHNDGVRRYELYEPAFRKAMPLQDFLRGIGGGAVYTGYDLREIELEGREATVKVDFQWHISQDLPGMHNIRPPVKTVRDDTSRWVWVDDDWYLKGPDEKKKQGQAGARKEGRG